MDKGFQILEQILKTSTFRHKLLASNIANVDTPGYKAKDVTFKEAINNHSMKLNQTSSNHISGSNLPKEVGGMTAVERTPWDDGNTVALDMELANMTENALLYQAGVTLLTKKFQMYKTAIKGN
ncbi:MAG: flagellar basal body rod protein FlgB [Desulfobacca sp.]|nr:flagellar basal body rod protein FlgB [Desulfobacca sp.]